MKIIILAFVLLLASINAKSNATLTPNFKIKSSSIVRDMALNKNKHTIIIATEYGEVQTYNYIKNKFIKTIKLDNITDFMGDSMKPEVFCVDVFADDYLFVSQSSAGGYTNVWLYKNNKLINLINKDAKKDIIKAKFISKDVILLAYLGSDISLFDIKTKKELQKIQASRSKFSDFDISEQKSVALTSESGAIAIIDIDLNSHTNLLKIKSNLDKLHTDNVYKLAYNKGIVATAGQDRQGVIYNTNTNKKIATIKSNFFVYITALSPNAQKVAFSLDVDNNVGVFDVKTMQKIAMLKGIGSKINAILFIDESTILISNNQNEILGYRLNKKQK